MTRYNFFTDIYPKKTQFHGFSVFITNYLYVFRRYCLFKDDITRNIPNPFKNMLLKKNFQTDFCLSVNPITTNAYNRSRKKPTLG